jgi:phage-related protein
MGNRKTTGRSTTWETAARSSDAGRVRTAAGGLPRYATNSILDGARAFPEEVRSVMGYALYLAQAGGKHPDAKPLRGFGGSGVLEVVDDFDGDTFRAVYTVKFKGAVFALHAFQKKSRKGTATARQDLQRVKQRLRQAERIHAEMFVGKGGSGEEEG